MLAAAVLVQVGWKGSPHGTVPTLTFTIHKLPYKLSRWSRIIHVNPISELLNHKVYRQS